MSMVTLDARLGVLCSADTSPLKVSSNWHKSTRRQFPRRRGVDQLEELQGEGESLSQTSRIRRTEGNFKRNPESRVAFRTTGKASTQRVIAGFHSRHPQ